MYSPSSFFFFGNFTGKCSYNFFHCINCMVQCLILKCLMYNIIPFQFYLHLHKRSYSITIHFLWWTLSFLLQTISALQTFMFLQWKLGVGQEVSQPCHSRQLRDSLMMYHQENKIHYISELKNVHVIIYAHTFRNVLSCTILFL